VAALNQKAPATQVLQSVALVQARHGDTHFVQIFPPNQNVVSMQLVQVVCVVEQFPQGGVHCVHVLAALLNQKLGRQVKHVVASVQVAHEFVQAVQTFARIPQGDGES
jgi:hypothetical protein